MVLYNATKPSPSVEIFISPYKTNYHNESRAGAPVECAFVTRKRLIPSKRARLGNTSFLLRYYCENVEKSGAHKGRKKKQRSRFQRVIIDDLFTFFFFKWFDICGMLKVEYARFRDEDDDYDGDDEGAHTQLGRGMWCLRG